MKNGIVLIGRASRTGLGAMSLDFVREMQPERVVLIDTERPLAHLEPFAASRPIVHSVRTWRGGPELVRAAIEGMRTVVGFETFYSPAIYPIARVLGVKVVMVPMWECSPNDVAQSDILLCLSRQDAETFPGGLECRWPVTDEAILPSPLRAWPPRLFVHNAGHFGGHGRNNTEDVMAAARYLEGTGARMLIRAQEPLPASWIHDLIDVQGEVADRKDLYKGDVSVFPMGFEGLSLPLNEAAANEMPTIVLDLPQWREWPYRVPAINPRQVRFYRRVTICRTSVVALGELMRAMALEKIERKLPPKPAEWSEFRELWTKAVVE